MSVQILLSSLHHNNPLCFPSIFFSKPEKQKLKKKKWTKSPQNQSTNWSCNRSPWRKTSPFWAASKRPPPRFLDRATSVGIEEHRRAPFTWDQGQEGLMIHEIFGWINPMFPGWYQRICVRFLQLAAYQAYYVVVLVVFSSTLVRFIYLLLFCLYDDHFEELTKCPEANRAFRQSLGLHTKTKLHRETHGVSMSDTTIHLANTRWPVIQIIPNHTIQERKCFQQIQYLQRVTTTTATSMISCGSSSNQARHTSGAAGLAQASRSSAICPDMPVMVSATMY